MFKDAYEAGQEAALEKVAIFSRIKKFYNPRDISKARVAAETPIERSVRGHSIEDAVDRHRIGSLGKSDGHAYYKDSSNAAAAKRAAGTLALGGGAVYGGSKLLKDKEKTAALSSTERNKLENEMHKDNLNTTSFSNLAPKSARNTAAVGGIAGAVFGRGKLLKRMGVGALVGGAIGTGMSAAGSAFWKNRGKGYLASVSDKNLQRGIKGIHRRNAGDPNAMNDAHWASQGGKPKWAKRVDSVIEQ